MSNNNNQEDHDSLQGVKSMKKLVFFWSSMVASIFSIADVETATFTVDTRYESFPTIVVDPVNELCADVISDKFICDTINLYYDSDNDGIPNWWESYFSRDGSRTGLDAVTDEDGDGMSNYEEYIAGTSPIDDNSLFIVKIELRDNSPFVFWEPDLNSNGVVRVYTILGKTNLTDAAWVCPTNVAHRFFKVKVALP